MQKDNMQKENLRDRAYSIIREKIVNCEFMPNQFLVESDLMGIVKASRTPIREALSKLEQEGLVRILPKRGVVVSDITMATLNEIFEIRLLIEPYMIRTYGEEIPTRKLREQLNVITDESCSVYSSKGFAADNDLHQLLIGASHNAYFVSMMEQIYAQNHRMRILSGMRLESRAQETREEHERILTAMLSGDYEKAACEMHEHLINSKYAAVDAMMTVKSQ